MLNFEDFERLFSGSLMKKVKSSIIPYTKAVDKSAVLKELYNNLISYTYHPSPPRDYIIANKGNHVARIIPAFEPKDYCLYFLCTRMLEDFIAVNYVEGTYGGWRMSNQLKDKEDELDTEDNSEGNDGSFLYWIPNSVDPASWKESWSEFQRKAYSNSEQDDYACIVKLDIANFYDNVNIGLLEKKLYSVIKPEYQPYVELLIHFLSHWNKKFEGYVRKGVGLPQDEISDSSRLLANFYLQEYDKAIKKYCDSRGANYLRYADDQLIFTHSKSDAEYLVYEASKLLSRIGLNINTSKVVYFESKERFNQHWAFEIFDLLSDYENHENINKGVKLYLEWKEKGVGFREHSVLRRIVSQDFNIFDASDKFKLLGHLFDKKFIYLMDSWFMNKLYSQLDEHSKNSLLKIFDELIYEYHFNAYHYNLMRFYEKNKIEYDKNKLLTRIQELKE